MRWCGFFVFSNCGIAEAFYREIPITILRGVHARLTGDLWDAALRFYRQYGIKEIIAQSESLEGR